MISNLIVSISFFGLGVLMYLVYRNVANAVKLSGHERLLEISYACARAGTIIVLGLITQAVFGQPVPLDIKSALYIVGLGLFTLGYLGIAVEGKKVKKRDR